MKMNIKGLVFVGFAAAVFASAANAADGDNKKVTSYQYTENTYEKKANKVEEITDTNKNSTTLYPSNKALTDALAEVGGTVGTGTITVTQNGATVGSFSANADAPVTVPVAAADWNATTGQAGEILNKPTIPDVYNATLTVKQGTDTLGTFTANSNTPTEINIPVPTAPNNSTITIYKSDGTTQVGSFTVDQATAGSINLPADSDTIYTFDEGAVAGQFKYSTDGGSTWTQVTVHNAQVTDNMVQTINSSSTSTTYPSAEAVYNFLSTPPTGVTCSDAAPCAFVLGDGAPEWRPIQQ
ncbi:MAG: hypothetical protein IKS08_02060 [Alphaproteobacteria bacterium]|nr:hypothetical protein [Alphaproteobacteria bacterium]